MRLIDADELRKTVKENLDDLDVASILAIIDNAPTVEQKYYERVIAQINPVIEARPQGEWNYIQAGMCVCPFCGAMPHKEYKNFCAKCGAKMQKGGAE